MAIYSMCIHQLTENVESSACAGRGEFNQTLSVLLIRSNGVSVHRRYISVQSKAAAALQPKA